MAKKSSRILVGLVCEETNTLNYVVTRNKVNVPNPLRLRKFSRKAGKVTWHKEKKSLD
jgi:ribosomal protein L33